MLIIYKLEMGRGETVRGSEGKQEGGRREPKEREEKGAGGQQENAHQDHG
jgi:hypothetical protein